MIATQELLDAEILIVDGQDAHVELLEGMLRAAGYSNVASTADLRQVGAMHEDKQYDLILLDSQLPDAQAPGLLAGLPTDGGDSGLPVVVLMAPPGHKLAAVTARATDVVTKPFDAVEVKMRIQNMLELRLLQKKLRSYNQELERAVRERTAQLAASEERFRRFTELAADWYWEQSESGEFTQVSGPVEQTLGLGLTAALGGPAGSDLGGWNESERRALHAAIQARQPFLDFVFSRVDASGAVRQFRVSGEPMFDSTCRYVGYRGVGSEVLTAR